MLTWLLGLSSVVSNDTLYCVFGCICRVLLGFGSPSIIRLEKACAMEAQMNAAARDVANERNILRKLEYQGVSLSKAETRSILR